MSPASWTSSWRTESGEELNAPPRGSVERANTVGLGAMVGSAAWDSTQERDRQVISPSAPLCRAIDVRPVSARRRSSLDVVHGEE